MVNFGGSVNVFANAATMAAPVGVIISPLFSVILIGMEADCTKRNVHGVGTCLLYTSALGLGTCWINQLTWLGQMTNVRDFLAEYCHIPKEHVICGACAVGYTNGAYPKPAPRKENTIQIIL